VGALVVQVSLNFLTAEDRFEAFEALVGENSDLIGEVLLELLDLQGFNLLGALVFLLALAGEDLHIDDGAFNSRRTSQRSVTHITGLFAEDGAQQLLFRSKLRLAFGSDLANENVAGFYGCTDSNDAAFVEITQRC